MTTKMAKNKANDEERQRLTLQIHEWNANRYDLFAITPPNEANEFFGVMRFFFQEADQRVSTKCIRVSNTASTMDVLNTLVEKFRPDMRMLTLPRYALYEVHVNGEERKLQEDEYPLFVQLNWGQDDREGRFLLKSMDEKTYLPKTDSITNTTEAPANENPGFKRKLSKREKKEQKKRDKDAKMKDKENKSPAGDGVAGKLYNELPDTSFTRSISNPEAVMRKRRQLKLEKKLQEIRSKDGGPDQGGTLKIYGESIRPDVPYKTLLLSTCDNSAYVVKETLDKYGMEKEDPRNFCLIQTLLPPGGPEHPGWGHKEFILDDDDCPLNILMHTPPSKGTVMFQLKRRTADMPLHKKKRSASATRLDNRDRYPTMQQEQQKTLFPFLVEIQPDGTEPYKAHRFQLLLNGTEVGSEQRVPHSGQYVQLHGSDIGLRHCVFTFTEGLVTVTPVHRDAETYVNDQRIMETTILQHGMVVRFGKMHLYRFCDPNIEKNSPPQMAPGKGTLKRQDMPPDFRGAQGDVENFETTFDVDGHIETKAAALGPHGSVPELGQEDLLPCSLQYKEEGEDAFLLTVIHDVNGNSIQFKLAPTYTLYMAVRYRVHKLKNMDMSPNEHSHWINAFTNKIVNVTQRTIQESGGNASALSFWMANSSELLHFLKQDREICLDTKPCQDHLAQAVQTAFHQLVDCMQADLHHVMPAFLDESTEDLQAEGEIGTYPRGKPTIGDVLQVLSSAMSLLRRCRVNAALTIQLFSQLFHFINMWLFNKLVLQPQMQLCTAGWGHMLKRRLGRVEIWAEKHGLELAADCHLARIIQAAHLLEAPKGNPDDIANISSTCFKLNSLQLRALLESYIPSTGEPHIPPELLSRVVSIAQSMSDELLRSEGREVRLEEDPDLQLPFLLPEDGYSCDIVKGVPSGLADFLLPVTNTGLSQLQINTNSFGSWTIYMGAAPPQQKAQQMEVGRDHAPPPHAALPQSTDQIPMGMPNQPEVVKVTFNKVKGSIGLSIVAAKGENQAERGIYVKSVVQGGGAAQDGRLQAGDQLLKVDGHSLVGLTQERAAEYMMHTGQTVTLEVAKQGAIFHGLTSLLTQPSPVVVRTPNNQGASPGMQNMRPKSEDVNKLNVAPESPHKEGGWGTMERQRPLQMQHGARSSPNIPNVHAGERLPGNEPGHREQTMPRGGPQHQPPITSQKPHPPNQYMGPDPVKSKSTTHLDYKGAPDQQSVKSRSLQPSQPQYQSHPDLNQSNREKTYENYPMNQYRQSPYGMSPNVGPDDRDMKQSKSLGNIRQPDVSKPEMSNRSQSGEFDQRQVQQWQQKQQSEQSWNQPKNRYDSPKGVPEGQQAVDGNREVPRMQANNQQYQKNFFQNTQAGSPNNLTLEQMRLSESKQRYSPEKPASTSQPPPPMQTSVSSPPEIPRVDLDPYKAQQQFFDPRQQQQKPSPNTYPQDGDYRHWAGQDRRAEPPGSGPLRPQQGTPVTSAAYPYQRKEQSPDLPPPPPSVPPPDDGHETDLPPPPAQIQDHDRALKAEQDRMRRRDNMEHTQQMSSPMRPNMPGFPAPRPSTQQQLSGSTANYYNFDQNNPAGQMRGTQSESQMNATAYHYAPRPAPPQSVDRSISEGPRSAPSQHMDRPMSEAQPSRPAQPKNVDRSISDMHQSIGQDISVRFKSSNQPPIARKPPPIASKPPPPTSTKPTFITKRDSSPWGLELKEKENLDREKEIRYNRPREIMDLQSRPNRTVEEEERLKRLYLDEEFDRRVQEASDKKDDEGDDSDTDMTASAIGRTKVLQLMQRDVERRQQQKQEEKEHRQIQEEQAEAQKIERQERRLAQFQQERDEQKQRQVKRQERKAQEMEDYLQKQRDMRERQHQELDEQRRLQKMEEERLREKQREELQKKKKMEQEQLREIQAVREEEERKLRAAIRRQEEEKSRQKNDDRTGYRIGPPAPPERKSSKDIYNNRPVSMSNLGQVEDPGGPMRSSVSASTVMQQQAQDSKKSVSFNTNLTEEIDDSRHNSTSSEMSYRDQPSQFPQEMRDSYQSNQPPASSRQEMSNPYLGNQLPLSNMPDTQPTYQGSQPEMHHTYRGNPPNVVNQPEMQRTYQPNQPSSSHLETHQSHPGDLPSGGNQPVMHHSYQSSQSEMNQQYQGSQSEMNQQYQGSQSEMNQQYQGSQSEMNQQYQGNQPPNANVSFSSQPFQRPSYSPATPNNPYSYSQEDPQNRTPRIQSQNNSMSNTPMSNTPGVIGAQEVYRDPRDRIAANKQYNVSGGSEPQRMSFRDKMKMFAKEAGENTPQEKTKISRAQQALEVEHT